MGRNAHRTGFRVALAVGLACLFCLLAVASLAAPRAAASGFPTCGGSPPPAPPIGAEAFTVTGIVRAHTGAPVECVQVFAFSGPARVYTYTTSSGLFTLTLGAGVFYDIVFNPPLGLSLASQSARGVHVSQTLDVTLPAGHAISGTVYRDAAKTIPVGNVAIFAFGLNTYSGFGLPPSQPSGVYQISLETGRWELTFTPPPFSSLGPTRTAAISLTADIVRDIVLPPGFTVRGQVITGGGDGQAGVEVFAQDPTQWPIGYGFTPTGPDGRYTGTLPSGNFDIQFLAPPFLGLGSTVMTDVIGPPDALRNLTLPAGYTLSGTVRCGAGVANAFVHAAPHTPIAGDDINGWGRFAGSDGFYALALQTGTYTVSVSPPGGSWLLGRIVPSLVMTRDVSLDFDLCVFLPIVLKSNP